MSIDADDVMTEVTSLTRSEPWGPMRDFRASVVHLVEPEPVEIGEVRGHLLWGADLEDVAFEADGVSEDLARLGAVADDIMAEWVDIDTVVFDERIVLKPESRGNHLVRAIIADALDLLRLVPARTLIVFQPEPLQDDGTPLGSPYPAGVERDAAMVLLCAGYEAAGFERRRDSVVWWLPTRD